MTEEPRGTDGPLPVIIETEKDMLEDMPWFFPVSLWGVALLCLAIVLLGGCATAGEPQPHVVVGSAKAPEPQKIPVLMPCLKADQIPKPPATFMRAAQSGEKMELAAIADIQSLKIYVVESQGRMLDCVKSLEEQMKEIK